MIDSVVTRRDGKGRSLGMSLRRIPVPAAGGGYRMRSAPILSGVAVFCTAAAATCLGVDHRAREVVCPRATGAVTVDGRITERAWGKAAQIVPLLTLRRMAKPRHDKTSARVLYDESALYLAVTCNAAKSKVGKQKPRDHRAILDTDHIEIFVNPFPNRLDYYHLAVDRWGNVLDAWKTQQATRTKAIAWQGKWRAVVAQSKDGWTAEVALPYAAFGAEPARPGDWWRFKIGRDGGRDGPLMWPPNPLSGFHRGPTPMISKIQTS